MKTTIKDRHGNIIKQIDLDLKDTILNQAKNAGIDMSFACLAGICSSCICNIEKWEEFVDKSYRMEPGFPLWDDEVMTCIGWLKKDISLNDEASGEIVLQTWY